MVARSPHELLTENEIAALEEIKTRVSHLFPVEEYILFGSKARGDSTSDSDVDLLVISERPLCREDKHHLSDEVFYANLHHETLFTSLGVDGDSWRNEPWQYFPLKENVEREGVKIMIGPGSRI